MQTLYVISTILTLFAIWTISHAAFGDVWIPDNEFLGYYDSDGVYTVVGAVKNTQDSPIIPNLIINVRDGENQVFDNFTLSTINPDKDLPFKLKIPEVKDRQAKLETPLVSFQKSSKYAMNVDVIYDKTLLKHTDGHTSGYVINNDTSPVYNLRVYAVIYGKDGKILDTGKSIETISRIDPGQKVAFSMYPDPIFATKVSYYSCFALGEDPTQTIRLQRNGNPFLITYVSSGYVNDAKFDDFSQSFSFTIRYPFPDKGFVNFMIPEESTDQTYSAMADGKKIDLLQSRDPGGFWHVAFNLPPQSTMHVTISGFEQHPLLPVGNFRNYLLIIIPIAAITVSIIIWKKRTN